MVIVMIDTVYTIGYLGYVIDGFINELTSKCDAVQIVYDKFFVTQAGKQMLTDIFL